MERLYKKEITTTRTNIKIVAVLNIGFTVIELVGGAITNSLAILSDALHDFGDSIVLVMAYKMEKIADRKPDWKRTYGYRRLSLLAAFLNAVVLLGGTFIILVQAIGRLIAPQPVHSEGMIWIAIVGIVANAIGSMRLKRGKSHNEKMLSWHLFEDVLSWAGILVSALIIHFTGLYILDPIVTMLCLAIVLYGVLRNSKELFNTFLEGTPSHIKLHEVVDRIEKFEEIDHVYDVHTWSLDGKHNLFSMKAVVRDDTNVDALEKRIRGILDEYSVTHSTIELHHRKQKDEQEQDFLRV